MTLVVDATVAVKWIIDEGDADQRDRELRSEPGLIAPSLIVAEVGNALWKAVRRKVVREADARAALNVVFEPFQMLVTEEDLAERALEIAIALDHPIYDCFYLALAERERALLISADQRLLKAAERLRSVETRLL